MVMEMIALPHPVTCVGNTLCYVSVTHEVDHSGMVVVSWVFSTGI